MNNALIKLERRVNQLGKFSKLVSFVLVGFPIFFLWFVNANTASPGVDVAKVWLTANLALSWFGAAFFIYLISVMQGAQPKLAELINRRTALTNGRIFIVVSHLDDKWVRFGEAIGRQLEEMGVSTKHSLDASFPKMLGRRDNAHGFNFEEAKGMMPPYSKLLLRLQLTVDPNEDSHCARWQLIKFDLVDRANKSVLVRTPTKKPPLLTTQFMNAHPDVAAAAIAEDILMNVRYSLWAQTA